MRTLLIDNYDSYTYNLFQLLAQVNGEEPDVISNDAVAVDHLDLDRYDNVVISPGPGHPARRRDFGISGDILATTDLPILGVCLGHQGLASSAGGRVLPAPIPRHGHVSRVRHNDDLLFEHIPTEFSAVRYHSLAVSEPLPAELAAIAWAEDGVVMALRHRRRPRWGVQFHPESIETEYGVQLLRNFRDLCGKSATPVRVPTTAHRPPKPVRPLRRYRAKVAELDHAVDAERAFVTLYRTSQHAFWLDSSRAEPGLARFSLLGDASGPLSEVVSYTVGDGNESVFDYLQRELARRVIDAPTLPFDFTGGYVGYFGYELKADCGSPTSHRASYPDAAWIFADRFVVIDHQQDRTYLVALGIDPATITDAATWLADTAATLLTLPPEPPALGTADEAAPARIEPWLVRDRDTYLREIATCQARLRAGESYEINLTNAAIVPAREPGLDIYRKLRRLNPSPYAAYLRTDRVEVASSSPERFLRIGADRTVETKPIKGTAPRGATPVADELLRTELAADRKARAENLMVVDLMRNDLGRVCTVGSVHVPVLMAVESYQTMHQLVSTVRGTLRPDRDAIDCVRACFPGGSMTGAPKLRTLEIIEEVEDRARGIYSGAIGFLGCNGTADLNIVIRTMVLVDGQWHVGAGGAIVLDSDPADEYDEMLLKAAAPIQALDIPVAVT